MGYIREMLYLYISPHQHGFQRGRSPATNLMVFQSRIYDAFEEGAQVDAIELDFAKAFDRVSHALLLSKLRAYGFIGSSLQWLSSYLSERPLQVRYNGALSHSFMATSGVPQGSLLGPVLFTIFVNDAVDDLQCSYLLFADDIKLYRRITSESDLDCLQESLNNISEWSVRNKMMLNIDKCSCITFHRIKAPLQRDYTIHGATLKRSTSIKDLGVLFSHTLNWDRQVHAVCGRALRNLGLIHRLAKCFPAVLSLKLLYCALVRPHLEYCSVIWSPHQLYLKVELEGVQRRFLRLVGTRLGYRYSDVPLGEVASFLSLPSLETRRFNQDILFLYNLINFKLDCPDLLERVSFKIPSGTRSKDLFTRVSVSTNYARNSSILRMQRHGNSTSVDLDFFQPSGASFKKHLLNLQKL